METNLCILYNKELWFQIGELIQELIVLVKNCFLIDEKNHNNIWNLFGQDLFQFFEKFSDVEKEILPKTSYAILTIGTLRFQASYNENKLCFLEDELLKNINIFRNNLCIILFIKELSFLNAKIHNRHVFLRIFLRRIFLRKGIISLKINKFIIILNENDLQNIVNKSNFNFIIGGKQDRFKKLEKKKISSKFFSSVNFLIPSSNLILFSEKFEYIYDPKTSHKTMIKPKLDLIVQPHCSDYLELEKREWFLEFFYKNIKFHEFHYSILRKLLKNILNLKNNLPKTNKVYQNFLLQCNEFAYKRILRWSRISKKFNGEKNFIEKILRIVIPSISNELFLLQERQLILLTRSFFLSDLLYNRDIKRIDLHVQRIICKISTLKKKFLNKFLISNE